MKTKHSIKWHQDCLYNSKQYANKLRLELLNLEDKIERLNKMNSKSLKEIEYHMNKNETEF